MFIIRVVYYLLVLLCIGISLFLTYFGFERTFGPLTIYFTGVIGLLLFAADFMLQRNRERGLPWAPAFLLFILAATFSSVSNFNYLYTNFMTSDVLASTVREQYRVFSTDLTNTSARLERLDAVQEESDRRARIETELRQMWTQMNDPARLGCGERCAGHINAINALLGVEVTDLRRPGPSSTQAERKEFYDAFRGLVQEAQENSSVAGPFQAVRAVISQIDERLAFYGNADDALRAGADLSVLSQLSDDSQMIEREANAVLPASAQVDHAFIDPTLGRLGEIVYSLRNGFLEVPSLSATIMAAILSIVVDFVPILYAFVAFRPGEGGVLPEEGPGTFDEIDDGF
ncbi:hypothetical protein [Shimia ponticola]|uniref:hypothetical protein n=1 Tax=Shimia ponticola TaxID=2582893 RepID=UPI0011BF3EAA|nr:hypothetical protein [Shimia ponticola]